MFKFLKRIFFKEASDGKSQTKKENQTTKDNVFIRIIVESQNPGYGFS